MNPLGITILVTFSILCLGVLIILITVQMFGKKTPSTTKDYELRLMVSMVIPTRNEEKIIRERLENIVSTSYPTDKMEVLFIDASTDRTPDVINEYASKFHFIKLLRQSEPGFNGALNQGYSAATGQITVKSDCDAFPERDALKKLVANFSDASVGVVSGVHVIPQESKTESLFRKVQSRILLAESYLHSSLITHGAISGYRTNIIPRLPPEVTADDSEVVVSAIKKGYRAIVDPSVRAAEYYPESFILRREMKDRRAAGVIKVMLKNIGMMFNTKYGAFGLVCFPMVFFILVLGPILFTLLLALLILYGILFQPIILGILGLLLASYGLSFLMDNKLSIAIKTVADVYISSLVGIFKALRRESTWKRSERQRTNILTS